MNTGLPATDSLRVSAAARKDAQQAELPSIPATDGELLFRFHSDREEAAFEELIERHGAMVWRVCRSLLWKAQDAEDAYQATFLQLARSGRAIHASQSAAGWLYRVAFRTARRAQQTARRRREEHLESDPLAPEQAFPNLASRQMSEVLIEELDQLPGKYQTPLLLRYLQGESRQSIADRTDSTVAAVQGRLARGKQLLRRRLIRRGVTLSAAMAIVGLSTKESPAMPTLLAQQTLTTTLAATTGSATAASAAILTLSTPGSLTMFIETVSSSALFKPTAAAATLLVAALLATSVETTEQAGAATTPPVLAVEIETTPNLLDAESLPAAFTAIPPAATQPSTTSGPSLSTDEATEETIEETTFPVQLAEAPEAQTDVAPQEPAADQGRQSFEKYFDRNDRYGHNVAELQEKLNDYLSPSPGLRADGDYGPLTEKAVKRVQRAAGLPQTGFADEQVRALLGIRDSSDKAKPLGRRPALFKTVPAQGATDVDPALSEIRITFDRDMQRGMSWTGGPPHFPILDPTRKAKWIDRRTCVLPVKLEAGRFYRLGTNSSNFDNFISVEGGFPAVQEAIWFTTAGADAKTKALLAVPQVVSIKPDISAGPIDPKTKYLQVTFDQEMAGGMSWIRQGAWPGDASGRAVWDKQFRTCKLALDLEPGATYSVGLNGNTGMNFQSDAGVPLKPVVLQFEVANDANQKQSINMTGGLSEETVKVATPNSSNDPSPTADEPELSVQQLVQRGWQLFYQGKNVEAEADFRAVLEQDKRNLPALNGLAFSLLNQGKTAEAKPLFQKYLKREPKAAGPLNGLARCLAAEGDLDGAIKVWERGVRAMPGPSANASGLANAYLQKEEYAKAVPLFEMLAQSAPNNAYFKQGLSQAKEGLAKTNPSNDTSATSTGEVPRIIRRDDGRADGKKSLGGSGHLVRFDLPAGVSEIKSVRIHGSRYGTKKAPREDFEITFLSEDRSEILTIEHAPYGLFRRGPEKWTTVRLKDPVEVPSTVWVAVDFSPGQTKGVYLSYDTSTGGANSMTGLAQDSPEEHQGVSTGGDWMVQLVPVRETK